jgi:hypothetical protein
VAQAPAEPAPVPQTAPEAPDPAGHDHEDEAEHRLRYYDDVEVAERGDNLLGIAASSNEGSTGGADLEKRPILRAGELVETVPGAIATQHSGGGKANQYFLRGFNLDHGTDFALWVGGMPVNMPTHGHGQGYADVNFLIPELVERARYRKGPYRTAVGDFSSAGSVDFDLVRSLPRGIASLTLGSFDYQRALLADTFALAGGSLTGALEYFHDDGPWERPDDYGRWNGFLGYARGDAFRGWSVQAMGSDGEWLASDQLPRRAVDGGLVDAYGILDPGPRGDTARYSLSAESHFGSAQSLTHLAAYAIRYDFRLYSNFTYFLEDPRLGDQFEQKDDRWILGASASHTFQHHVGDAHGETTFGAQVRHDDISNGLFRTSDLARTGVIRQDEVDQVGAGFWGDTWVRLSESVRVNAGLRADYYRADVEAVSLSVNSGTADEWMLNPKLSIVYRPLSSTELSLNLGSGSELLFVGDGGTTEASRPSRRLGVEWTNFWRVSPKLGLDLDLTLTDARFTDEDPVGPEIPGAIETTVSAGATVDDLGRWFGALRLRYLSGGPLVEDGSVTWGPTALLSGRVGFNVTDRLQLVVDGFNLLGRDDDDIAYYYLSRLPGEPLGGVEDVHFHPVVKPSLRASVVYRF